MYPRDPTSHGETVGAGSTIAAGGSSARGGLAGAGISRPPPATAAVDELADHLSPRARRPGNGCRTVRDAHGTMGGAADSVPHDMRNADCALRNRRSGMVQNGPANH